MANISTENKITKEIAKRLVEYRMVFHPESASAFAKEINVPQTTWSGYERGTRNIPNDLYDKLSNEPYNVNLTYLITGKGEMFISDRKFPKRTVPRLLEVEAAIYDWGDRLRILQRFEGLSDEEMANILNVSIDEYLKLILESPTPSLKLQNAIKANWDILIDDLYYDEKGVYRQMEEELKKDKLAFENLSPEQRRKLRNI